jgi:Arm DNA-binding domain
VGKLNALDVTRAKPGMHGDGDGLWLFVTKRKDDTLSRRWVFRYRRHDRYSEVPIGPFPAVSLAAARVAANKHRAELSTNVDPAQQRRDAIEAKKAELAAAKTAMSTKPYTFRRAVGEYVDQFGKEKWRSTCAAKAFVANLDNH